MSSEIYALDHFVHIGNMVLLLTNDYQKSDKCVKLVEMVKAERHTMDNELAILIVSLLITLATAWNENRRDARKERAKLNHMDEQLDVLDRLEVLYEDVTDMGENLAEIRKKIEDNQKHE